MSEPRAFTGDEKAVLRRSLERHRDAVLWKLEGLDDEQLRKPMVPSGTSILGLVRHLADVEYGWFCWTFGRPTEPGGDWGKYAEVMASGIEPEDDPEPPLGSLDEVLAYCARARAAANVSLDELSLDDTGTAWFGPTVSLRWVAVHEIEETARHAGHIDILRELIDGTIGDHRPS